MPWACSFLTIWSFACGSLQVCELQEIFMHTGLPSSLCFVHHGTFTLVSCEKIRFLPQGNSPTLAFANGHRAFQQARGSARFGFAARAKFYGPWRRSQRGWAMNLPHWHGIWGGQVPHGCGSKLYRRGYAGVGPCFHLPGFHFGTGFLSHSHMSAARGRPDGP